jgi:hypothetical protein
MANDRGEKMLGHTGLTIVTVFVQQIFTNVVMNQ